MRLTSVRLRFALLLLAAGCDYTSPAGPKPVDPPPVIPPETLNAFPDGLWTVSGAPGEILRLDPAQLLTEGSQQPAASLFTSSASLFTFNSVAFDSTGTMWVASQDDSLLLGFRASDDGRSGFTTPSTIIAPNARSISGPSGIAFDRDRSLWVANFYAGTIVRFDRTQLASSGSPVPSVTISGVGHPTGIAFDVNGTLWVTDLVANTVSRYLRGQLLTSGEKEPAIVLSSNAGSLLNPSGIAFDSFNNMWIANTGNQSITAFRPPQRASSGAPAPFLTLGSTQTTLGVPTGLAFDGDGSLWVMGISGVLSKFMISSIAASGPAEPSLQIKISDHVLLWSIAFWPKVPGLPLN
ncbi:MAG TPA: NHL repeat-containing protein [Gemmatimonadaceae bacterium]|nr:NHL repeat-containing protein [Gemmatimonadaceae bacterium]